MDKFIKIKGARENNLKNIDLKLPKNKLIVFTGLSGSGKTTLAMDTIYAEGQRRYVESLSSYARQFLGELKKPDVDKIEGLAPSIAISQKTTSHNPRSTIGTITEIYDFLRLLYARIGVAHCPKCGGVLESVTIDQIVDSIIKRARTHLLNDKNTQKFGYRAYITAVLISDKRGTYDSLFLTLRKQGWNLIRVDGSFYDLTLGFPKLDKYKKHSISVVLDTIHLSRTDFVDITKDATLNDEVRSQIFQAVDTGISLDPNVIELLEINDKVPGFPDRPQILDTLTYNLKKYCAKCDISMPELEPKHFSFNSPSGACPVCNGLGVIKKIDPSLVLDSNKPLTSGGIIPLTKYGLRDTVRLKVLEAMARENDISLDSDVKDIPKRALDLVLYGTGDKRYEITYFSSTDGSKKTVKLRYLGVIPYLEKRYKKTDSEFIRQEIEKYMITVTCDKCKGARLNQKSLAVTILDKNIAELTSLNISEFYEFMTSLPKKLGVRQRQIAKTILRELTIRTKFLLDVGLGYLTLDRSATTLSGGESQRIRLASQIGTGLTGVIYVLDEPSIGLHAIDQHKLIETLKKLRDLGNTVIVVEHDYDTIVNADYIVDFGPGAGVKGGNIVFKGTLNELKKSKTSVTGPYISGKKSIEKNVKKMLKKLKITEESVSNGLKRGSITLRHAKTHNLKDITVDIPLGKLISVTGVSGSGKSSLILETLYPALQDAYGKKVRSNVAKYTDILIPEKIDKVVVIDQSPIGRTPRSNPATYTKVFDDIRALFAQTKEAKLRGYKPGRFSFNVKGGRCEACKGEGQIRIEMQFLPDIYITCDVCHGKRYVSEVLEVFYKGKNIADVLDMTVDEAYEFFKDVPNIARRLKIMQEIGLGYIKLGQPAPTLSGGEAQRIKLASELYRRSTGRSIYILDEPTTGLHFADIEKLLVVLKRLVASGNTVIVIEHNLDFISQSDWIIDLGPEGGDNGGQILYNGPVKGIVDFVDVSHTAQALRHLLK